MISLHLSDQRCTGLLSLHWMASLLQKEHGGEDQDYWSPERRPQGQNLAFHLSEAVPCMNPERIQQGSSRPTCGPQAWVADPQDTAPWIRLSWEIDQTLRNIELELDVDYEHPMESAQWGHPERVVPFVVTDLDIENDQGQRIARISDNHHGRIRIDLPEPATTRSLTFHVRETGGAPAAIHRIRVW
jgi:hypothetical protein